MKAPRRIRHRLILCSVRATPWLFVVLMAGPAQAEAPDGRRQPLAMTRPGATGSNSSPARALPRIDDMALRPDRTLVGQVLAGSPRQTVAGLTVRLLQGRQTVAATTTDVSGRFAFTGPSGGVYRVVVDTVGGPCWRFCRVWTFSGAPPHAHTGIRVPLRSPLVRAQSPFPVTSFSKAATIAAIATGAITTPIVYHSVKRDDDIPASP